MKSRRISATILLMLMLVVPIGIFANARINGRQFPKYNPFYYMKEYMSEIESFLQENFPFGDELKNSAVKLQLWLGEQEHEGVFIGEDILIEDIGQPD